MNKLLKIILCGILLCGCKPQEEEPVIEDEPIVLVSNGVYADPKNPNEPFILAFNKLTEDLVAGNMEAVTEDVAICFVFDFFTLKNKEGSSDIGGLAYLPKNRADEFSTFAENNYYKNYNHVLTEYGKDSLPEVVNVTIESKTETRVKYLDYTYDGYELNLVVEYAQTTYPKERLKSNMTITCLIYDGKAMIVSLK